jgi:phage baseplate assembly protein V
MVSAWRGIRRRFNAAYAIRDPVTPNAKGLFRRLWNFMAWGMISQVNDGGTAQIVQINFGPGRDTAIHDQIPVAQLFGLASNPPLGTDAMVVHYGADPSNAVVVATNHQPTRPTGQNSGETKLYNAEGAFVYLSNKGIVVNAVNQPVTVENATTVTVYASQEVLFDTPILKCTGDIIDNVGGNTDTMLIMRQIYNGHIHGGVKAGLDDTSIPLELMDGGQGPGYTGGGGGVPNPASGVAYAYAQTEPSQTWTVSHNLGFNPAVTALDSDGNQIEGDVSYPDANTVALNFSQPVSGSVFLN